MIMGITFSSIAQHKFRWTGVFYLDRKVGGHSHIISSVSRTQEYQLLVKKKNVMGQMSFVLASMQAKKCRKFLTRPDMHLATHLSLGTVRLEENGFTVTALGTGMVLCSGQSGVCYHIAHNLRQLTETTISWLKQTITTKEQNSLSFYTKHNLGLILILVSSLDWLID